MKTALLLAARNPNAPRTGRIAVLETAVRSLRANGLNVIVAAITHDDLPETWAGAELRRINPPSLITRAIAVTMALPSRRTLNEALFSGRSVTRAVMELADEVSADVVIGDGLRVWSPLLATGRPVIMHLDDLLSDRYSSPEFSAGNDSILGYFGSQIPAALRPLAERVAKLTLGMEAHRARRQEILIARTANVTAMTSEAEAQVLAERSGTGVVALPMAVDARGASVPSKAPANSAVFLGVLHFGPNRLFTIEGVAPRAVVGVSVPA